MDLLAARNAPSAAPSDNVPLAVGTIVFTVLALSLGDALIKLTSGGFVIWQIFVVRSLLAVPLLLAVIFVFARGAFAWPRAPGWTSLRSLLLVSMWVFYYLSLPQLQLSIAAAAYYTLPLFITLFSAAFVGDRVGAKGWIAVVLGFLGILLILRPRAEDFNAYALLPLLSAMFYAVAMILTRTKCRSEHPLMLSLALNIAFILVGGLATLAIGQLAAPERSGFLLAPWSDMGAAEWATMSLLAAAILIGSIGAAVAYQKAPSSLVGTFDFAYVGFAVIWGLVIFAEFPDALSIGGIALIVIAGILSLRA